jgi:hypothetical protein
MERIDSRLAEAKAEWLKSLDKSRLLKLMAGRLKQRAAEADTVTGLKLEGENGLQVKARKLSEADVREILTNAGLPAANITVNARLPIDGDAEALEIDTGKVRIRVSIDEALDGLLEDKRQDLASALLGPELLAGETDGGKA